MWRSAQRSTAEARACHRGTILICLAMGAMLPARFPISGAAEAPRDTHSQQPPDKSDSAQVRQSSQETGATALRQPIAVLKLGNVVRVQFGPDSRTLATSSRYSSKNHSSSVEVQRKVKLWDARTGKLLGKHSFKKTAERSIAKAEFLYSPDAKTLAVWSGLSYSPGIIFGSHHPTGSSVMLLDVKTGKLRSTLKHSGIYIVMFVGTGETLATFNDSGKKEGLRTLTELKLWDTATGEEKHQLDHIGPIILHSLTPFMCNGKLLAALTARNPCRFTIWNVATGTELAVFEPQYGQYPISITNSADEKIFAFVQNEFSFLELWNTTTNEKLIVPIKRCVAVTFVPNNRTLFTATFPERQDTIENLISDPSDRTALLQWWDTDTGKQRASQKHPGYLDHYCMPDGKTLITLSPARFNQPGLLKLWDATTGRHRASLEHEAAWPISPIEQKVAWPNFRRVKFGTSLDFVYVKGIVVSPKCDTIGIASEAAPRGEVHLLDVATGKQRAFFPHPSPVCMVAVTQDGKTLAVAGGGHDHNTSKQRGDLRLWDLTTRKPRDILIRHDKPVRCVAFSPNGKTLVSASSGSLGASVTQLWDVATGREVGALECPGRVDGLAYHPNGAILAMTTHLSGELTLWDVRTKTQEASLSFPEKIHSNSGVTYLAFTPDGKTLAARSPSGVVKLWNMQTHQSLRTYRRPYTGYHSPYLALTPDCTTTVETPHGSNAFSDGTRKEPHILVLRDAPTGKVKATLDTKHSRIINLAAFSPDGKTLASGTTINSYPRSLRKCAELMLWDLGTGTGRFTWKPPIDLQCIKFTPDGKTLIVAGTAAKTTKLTLWDIAKAEERFALKDISSCAAFSPDGKILVTGSLDSWNTVTLRDVATGRILATLPGTKPVFSPDSKILALRANVPGKGLGVKLWDVAAICETPEVP